MNTAKPFHYTRNTGRRLLSGVLIAGLSIGSLRAADTKPDGLETAIGGVLIKYFVKYQELGTPPSGSHILAAINDGRAQIKALPEAERAKFYWTILMTINLDGHYLEETQRMILEDCRNPFLQHAEHFLSKNGISSIEARDRSFPFASHKSELSGLARVRLHYLLLRAKLKDG